MTEGEVIGLVRTHLYGTKGMPEWVTDKHGNRTKWSVGRDVSCIRKILKDRPGESYNTIAHAILGIAEMRGDKRWFKPKEQLTMRIFWSRTKLNQPYWKIAQGRYYQSQASGRKQPNFLGPIFQEMAARGK